MYLSRLYTLFSMYSNRNIISYSTLLTKMYELDGIARMRTERTYDQDTGIFIYSHIRDYFLDSDISEDKKIIITNKFDWYIKNKNNFNIRYIPNVIHTIKNKNMIKLENIEKKENVIKIVETTISSTYNELELLLLNKNIEDLKNIFGDIYLIISNMFSIHKAKQKFLKEIVNSNIIFYNYDKYLTSKSSLFVFSPQNNMFTLLPNFPYYLNYDTNEWYWFKNDLCNNDFNILFTLLNLNIDYLPENLCHVSIPINEQYIEKIFQYHYLLLKYLNSYEIDFFNNCKTQEDCINFLKNEINML